MSSVLKPTMNTPQTAIGKGVVGESTPPPEGKKGLKFKVALFFDGTMNNRTNTEKRISSHDEIIDKKKKNMLSSYANFFSNVAILELMNIQRKAADHHVSVYVEGIGTVDFVEEATKKNLLGKEVKVKDADNSNDQQPGFAFGTGSTGIVDRVTKGILLAKEDIKDAYEPEDAYIEEITINVIGFSRGAAAARHCVSRYLSFRGPWEGQQSRPPKLIVNFVGLFETVSSYDEKDTLVQNGIKDKFGELFTRNVSQLRLALGKVPKRVVHLTAQNEFRYNFALTNIDSTRELGAGKGFEVSLPGVHSDVGGGYVEFDPKNPTMDPSLPQGIRDLNKERRLLTGPEEQQYLVEQGWYTDAQLAPADWDAYMRHETWENHRASAAKQDGRPFQRSPYLGQVYGTRYLTNQYQYVSLYLMLGLAQKPVNHEPMVFSSLDEAKYETYRVPADLLAVRDHFAKYVGDNASSIKRGLAVDFADDTQAKLVRNKYLHRSTVLAAESEGIMKTTWFAYKRAKGDTRVVFSDLHEVAAANPVSVPDLSTVTLEQIPEERRKELGLSTQK